ncbi:MAG: PilT/PilU family type 4a pilus ATPase [Proteobacteria bacterium]|nr:PilT/PilU family type 4a pilus ATPase [Pseudomonadota bacterium]
MKRFENVISGAVRESMSDIYITGGHPVVSRKNGIIQFHASSAWTHEDVDDLVRKLLNPRQLSVLRERKSVDFAISLCNARLRINIFTTARGLSFAVRILPGKIPTIDELNLHTCLHEIATIKSGLVLTCGATGVGKTTTVAAIIKNINESRRAHIITLENPIEYRFQSSKSFIQQRELGFHMPSFEQGLIDVLRENPDVIVVGELREMKTMQLTLNAAESGHLVIATMHASSAEEAIYRLCNAVPPEAQNEIRYQLASTLNWIIIQELVHLKKIGYRVPLLTIVRGTQSIKNIIRENKLNQLNSAIQIGKNEGMFTAERYLNDYLNTHDNFIPSVLTFRPTAEVSQEILYQSPLTDDSPERISPKKLIPRREPQPIFIRSGYSHEETEHILNLDDDAPLQ